jgi:predicted AlkP superfamily phosphohydrolase/phosphomutase
MKEGFYSVLKVTNPPVTIPSFPCIFSGLSVKDLGYFTFVNPVSGVFSSDLWRDKSIFSIKDLKIFSLNLPSTYPAWKINGEIITGLLTPQMNKKMCYPKELINLIKKDWIIDGKNIKEVFKAFNIKKELFIKKLEQDFNLLIYIIRVPDCITHHPKARLNQTFTTIRKGYIEIDKFLGTILKKRKFDNLFIISDHGLKLYHHEFNIKRFLEKKNLVFYNNDLISKVLSIFIKIMGYFNLKIFNTTYFHNKFKELLEKTKNLKKTNSINSFLSTKFFHFYSNYGGILLGRHDKINKENIKKILLQSKYVNSIETYDGVYLPDFIIQLKDKYLFSVKSSFFIKNRFN